MVEEGLLVEERTSIWCPTCAEIDPELAIVAKSMHLGNVGLHVDDAFENDASLAHKISRQTDTGIRHSNILVDGIKTAEGYDAWGDVQDRILSRKFPGTPENGNYSNRRRHTTTNSRIWTNYLMVLEHDKDVPVGVDNPGEDVRDRVLVGMQVIDWEGNISEYGDLDLPKLWSVIMIHEPVEGGEPYGVVEISNLEYEENSV